MLNKPEATPGPWEAIDGIIYPAAGVEDGRDWIADLRCASNENANAALIAAAPELLDALDQALKIFIANVEVLNVTHATAAERSAARVALSEMRTAWSYQARAAIRKAKGEKA
jgi:hypothetical protein